MTGTLSCRYCGLWLGEGGGHNVHPECHDAAYYRAALTRVRGMAELPPPGAWASGRHQRRALRRVALERYLEVVTGQAAT